MTATMVIATILMPLGWWVMSALNKMHRDETGVNAPSRSSMRKTRRNARKKGIGDQEAAAQWLARKQAKQSAPDQTPADDNLTLASTAGLIVKGFLGAFVAIIFLMAIFASA